MNHDMMAVTAADLYSTFEGHVLPGSMFILWALVWIGQNFRAGALDSPSRALESSLFVPVLKVVLPLIGVWVEIPGEGWGPTTTLMSLQHVTMYSAFALTGIIDLLAHRGLLSRSPTFVGYALAQLNAGWLFWGHAIHEGVDGSVHRILASVFFVVAGLGALEVFRPTAGLAWLRMGAQLVLGGWFILGAWILYLSGWDLSASYNVGRASMYFSWMVMGIASAVLAARILADRRGAPVAG
ncbi:MAG: hypothetical protein FJ207_10505 [Gemmatimonadetes bacterium]|nr:hypothetical protein [Gemmatimonadota bacterium]